MVDKSGPPIEVLRRQALSIGSARASGWMKVILNGREEPSFRFKLIWERGDPPSDTFLKITGLGPFSSTLFEAIYQKDSLAVAVMRDKTLYGTKGTGGWATWLSLLIVDPWAIALMDGVGELDRGNAGGIVLVRPGQDWIRAEFSRDFAPQALIFQDGEIRYDLPHSVLLRVYPTNRIKKGVTLDVRLDLKTLFYSPSKVTKDIGILSDYSGFYIRPLSDLLQRAQGSKRVPGTLDRSFR